MNDLKNLTTEQRQLIVEEINKPEKPADGFTEVTSVKEEERKTGVKIEVPTAEKLVAMASASLIKRKSAAHALMKEMSKKQIIRAVTAFLDLPTEGLPVYLKDDKEKKLFSLGQRVINDRFIIIQHYINQQIALERSKQNQNLENENVQETQSST